MPFNAKSDETEMSSVRNEHGTWLLNENVVYFHPKANFPICAPQGMIFDLASIPPFFRSMISNDDYRIRRPAAIHDAMYLFQGHMPPFLHNGKKYNGRILTRAQADRIFYDALREEGVSWMKAKLMYLAVRIGGAHVWDS